MLQYIIDYKMCFQVQFSVQGITFKLSQVYLIIVFVYTLTMMILAIIANQVFEFHIQQTVTMPIPLQDVLINWNANPIYNIYIANSSGCGTDNNFFNLVSGSVSYVQWWNTNSVQLCYKTISGYNFNAKNIQYPQCKSNEQICGGVYIQNKYCAPVGQCPINGIKLVSASALASLDQTKYTTQITINSNYYLAYSTLVESLPISQISIFGSQACIPSQYTNYQYIFSNALCTQDARFTLLDSISLSIYESTNSISSTLTGTAGVYSRSYTQWSLSCRQQDLVNWFYRASSDSSNLINAQTILLIAACVNFGFTFLYDLYYFLQLYYDHQNKVSVNRVLQFLKTVVQWFHSLSTLVAFGLATDLNLFLQVAIRSNCSDTTTQSIIQSAQNTYSTNWHLNTAQFALLIIYLAVECSAFSICVDKMLKSYEQVQEQPSSQSDHGSVIFQPYIQTHFQPIQFEYASYTGPQQKPAHKFDEIVN